MRVSLMKNTTIFCLKALAAGGWLNPRTIARIRWPQSQQTEKKAATIRAHLDTLVRYCAKCGGEVWSKPVAARPAQPEGSDR
jgi:hypothetical protein